MISWIGLCAGEVWHLLEENKGELKMKTLISKIDAPKETILMAIGWLAREGHLVVGGELPNPMIRLAQIPGK